MIETQLKDIAEEKRICRQQAMQQRRLVAAQDNQIPPNMADIIQAEFGELASTKIAGYAAMRDELPIWDLLKDLRVLGATIYLPIVVKKGNALVFQSWQAGDTLTQGNYGEKTPIYDADAEQIIPDIILAPLLAFSSDGYRLGYGGGYYDRTLAKFRTTGKQVTFLGIAYSAQEVATLPIDKYDIRLDGIITEQGLRYFV